MQSGRFGFALGWERRGGDLLENHSFVEGMWRIGETLSFVPGCVPRSLASSHHCVTLVVTISYIMVTSEVNMRHSAHVVCVVRVNVAPNGSETNLAVLTLSFKK